jgi:hypothetical protein
MGLQQDLAELFRRDLTRLAQEIETFPDEELLWQTVPGVTNCAGNLALHLEGNLREYVAKCSAELSIIAIVQTSSAQRTCRKPSWLHESNHYSQWFLTRSNN